MKTIYDYTRLHSSSVCEIFKYTEDKEGRRTVVKRIGEAHDMESAEMICYELNTLHKMGSERQECL